MTNICVDFVFSDVRVVVLRSNVEGVFCAGADLKVGIGEIMDNDNANVD
jgi:enoyl-CoA hydratase/carnithine racemase